MLFTFEIWFILIRFIYLTLLLIHENAILTLSEYGLKKNKHGPHNITITIFCINLKISKLFNMTKFGDGDFMRTYPNFQNIQSISCIFPEICIPTAFHRNWFSIYTWGITSTNTFLITGKTRKYLYMHKYLFWQLWNCTLSEGQNTSQVNQVLSGHFKFSDISYFWVNN